MRKHPVIVYWERSKETAHYLTIKECAASLNTSTSHIKRLLESGKIFKRGNDFCTIDDGFVDF